MARTERIEFTGTNDCALAARLDLPDSPPRAYALFAHCFTCSKDSPAASRISKGLTTRGIAVLRFDFTGLGESDGDFADSTFSSNIGDLVHAADYLRSHRRAPQLLIGHSLGGAAVLAAAESIAECRAVVTIGAPSCPEHVTHLLGESREEIDAAGSAEVILGGRTFTVRKSFLEDIGRQPTTERIARLGRALLVMHSPIDETVGADNAREIFDLAHHPKSFIALDGANHLLTSKPDSAFAAEMIATWSERYIVAESGEESTPSAEDEQGSSVIVTEVDRAFTQHITSRSHEWIADEPIDVGGADAGPNPYELLLSALGACTSMTLRLYAKRKGWDIGRVCVTLEHDRVYAVDAADCEDEPRQLERIVREIQIDGDLDDAQRSALQAIADKCPVHRTLESPVVVETEVF